MAFFVCLLGIIFLTAFFAFLAIDFAAFTTCLVTDFFLAFFSHRILLQRLDFFDVFFVFLVANS